MKPLSSYFGVFAIAFILSLKYVAADENFVQCLQNYSHNNSTSISNVTYTQTNSSYLSILDFSAQNLRFTANTTLKPQVIVTPLEVSHIQATILCAQRHDLQIRTRSGGHDYEGLSYAARSEVPFLVLDLINFREIQVDVENSTAWVQAGATVGELYYGISQKSQTLGFPAGFCSTIGLGGHIGGGGYGSISRKHGLAADNIIDANIIDVKGRLLDRESMGEDLFWAIRGGGGASFGVITAWKIKLVPVPSTLTLFRVSRTLEQNAAKLIHKWQLVTNKLDDDIFFTIYLEKVKSSQTGNLTVQATFESLYLGGVDKIIPLMEESLPELGLVREDCTEMSWIESVHNLAGFTSDQPLELLLNRSSSITGLAFFKGKTDYVQHPIPDYGFEGLWQFLYEDVAAVQRLSLFPYGGIMDEISESEIPFPHRAGNIFFLQYTVFWLEEGDEAAQKSIDWIRRVYNYTEPFVSKSPRQAYVNGRDLDIGVNNNIGYTSYQQASIWGLKYFKNNFKRLVNVKTMVDPFNFFRYEQSIPSLVQLGRK